ncbi:hypothetical protein JWG39_01330 [Desulforhopalus vacuolatus]|uniref:hypothetical protein n=1 Tax=Desulforhopalus vacuolatus TaxID=40414 RepID=UPI00196658B4|nr:hypothetical protein [Desulforhopalus vacuolatus]MBM9518455.1 hypothetical protein [Desulforhopalus vacuolatus]
MLFLRCRSLSIAAVFVIGSPARFSREDFLTAPIPAVLLFDEIIGAFLTRAAASPRPLCLCRLFGFAFSRLFDVLQPRQSSQWSRHHAC